MPRCRPAGGAAVELVTAQFAPALGRSLADAAAEPWGLLQDRFLPSPPTLGFRLLASNRARPERIGGDFFGGLAVPPGSESRRAVARLRRWNAAICRQRMASKRRQVQAIRRHVPDAAAGRPSSCWPRSTS